jgi:hypothetical protein
MRIYVTKDTGLKKEKYVIAIELFLMLVIAVSKSMHRRKHDDGKIRDHY